MLRWTFCFFLPAAKRTKNSTSGSNGSPSLSGATIDPYIKPFEPTLEGVFPAFDPTIGGESFIKWSQLFSLYQIDQISYEDMAAEFGRFFTTQGLEDFREFLRNRRRSQIQDEQLAVGLRSSAQLKAGKEAEADWLKYRNVVVSRQLAADQTLLSEGLIFADPEALRRQSFYQYTAKALDNIRKSVGAENARVLEGHE